MVAAGNVPAVPEPTTKPLVAPIETLPLKVLAPVMVWMAPPEIFRAPVPLKIPSNVRFPFRARVRVLTPTETCPGPDSPPMVSWPPRMSNEFRAMFSVVPSPMALATEV